MHQNRDTLWRRKEKHCEKIPCDKVCIICCKVSGLCVAGGGALVVVDCAKLEIKHYIEKLVVA